MKKTVVEMFQRLLCSVCGFMAVPNILQAVHSATDLCCLNPAALHSCQTMTEGGQAACVCVCMCVLSHAFELNTSISNLDVCVF